MVRGTIDETRDYERILGALMNWEYIEEQKKGDGYDFVAPDGSKIEVKFDWDSIKTGNHFLEFEQTGDHWETKDDSGFSLSEGQADYWVVINNDFLRILRVGMIRHLIDSNPDFEKRVVADRKNNNRPGMSARGYLIPFTKLDSVVFMKRKSPIVRS